MLSEEVRKMREFRYGSTKRSGNAICWTWLN